MEVRSNSAQTKALRSYAAPYTHDSGQDSPTSTTLKILNRELLGRVNASLRGFGYAPVRSDLLPAHKLSHKLMSIFKHMSKPSDAALSQHSPPNLHDLQNTLKAALDQAQNTLTNLGLLDTTTASDIEQAQAIARQTPKPEPSAVNDTATLRAVMQQKNKSQTARLEITTKDGDVIEIAISHALSESSMLLQQDDNAGEQLQYDQLASTTHSLQYTVTGDLDEEEMQSVLRLMRKTGKLADDFFNGRFDQAYKRAMKLGFNSDEIAGFSLALQSDESRNETMANHVVQSPNANLTPVGAMAALGDFVRSFLTTSQSADAEILPDPAQQLGHLLQTSLQQHPSNDRLMSAQDMREFTQALTNVALQQIPVTPASETPSMMNNELAQAAASPSTPTAASPLPQHASATNSTQSDMDMPSSPRPIPYVFVALSEFAQVRAMQVNRMAGTAPQGPNPTSILHMTNS